jgi:integrase
MARWIGKWRAGRIYEDGDGRRRHVLERKIQGRRYTIVLPAEADPEAEFALFRRDPAGYATRARAPEPSSAPAGAIVLTLGEVERFESYLRSEKHRVEAYVVGVAGYLSEWAAALAGADLRAVAVDDLSRHLDRWRTARNYRINALRTFCAYLVRRQRLKPHENAAALLEITKPPPARLLQRQGYTIEQVERFYAALESQRIRDYYLISAQYGLHGTEIERIARGEVEITPVGKQGIAAVLRFIHKGRHDHRLSVDAAALAAVRRFVQAGKAPSTKTVSYWAQRAAREVGFVVHHGQLRHSVATWAQSSGRLVRLEAGGVSLQETAELLGHRSVMMIKDHYDNTEIPPMLVLPIRLLHPQDPASLEVSAGERLKARGG